MKTIVKHNDALISRCRCRSSYAVMSDDGEPWNGDGYLFHCHDCLEFFTLGRVVEDGLDRETLADRLLDPLPDVGRLVVLGMIDQVARMLAPLALGTVVIHLDGDVLAIHQRHVATKGMTRRHAFRVLPHATAWHAGMPELLTRTLGDERYWTGGAPVRRAG